jgi:hypothetical protein
LRDEAMDLVSRRGPEWASMGQLGAFVRSDSYSLKTGVHGAGPYNSLMEVLESLSTPRLGHDPLDDATPEVGLKLYRWGWQPELDPYMEVRVFVWRGDVVAISQQHLYRRHADLHPSMELVVPRDTSHSLRGWACKVLDAWTTQFKPRLERSKSWGQWVTRGITLDVGCLKGQGGSVEPFFIEINPSGAQYAAGSALFHWVKDEAILHGQRLPTVELRWLKQ